MSGHSTVALGRIRFNLALRFILLANLVFVMAVLAASVTASTPPTQNPDLPGWVNGGDEADFIQTRERQIALWRGWEPGQPFDPNKRLQALQRMEVQFQRQQAQDPEINSVTWTPIGPLPIPNGQTVTLPTAVSGRVTAIDIHPTNPEIAYVGTAQGGLYRTLDGGVTWTQLMDTAQSLAIGAVTISPSSPSTVFVGTGEGNLSLDTFFGVGLYRIDNADTAPVLNGPFETRVAGTGTTAGNGHAFLGTAITKIVVDPNDATRIFVGNTIGYSGMSADYTCCGQSNPASAFVGLYFSANATASTPTFSRVTGLAGGGLGSPTDIVFEPGSSDNLLVGVIDISGGTNNGIYRTTNASTASAAASPSFTRIVNYAGTQVVVKFAINKIGGVVTVLAATSSSSGTLLKSTDGGASWPTTLTAANGFCSAQCTYDMAVAMAPGDANTIHLGGSSDGVANRIYTRSTDGGTTFSGAGVSDVGLHADTHAIAVAPSNPAVLYTGNDGGIFKSTDGGTSWTSLNNTGFGATQFMSVAVHPTDRKFSIGGTQDNGTLFYQPDGAWIRADFGDGGFSAIDQNATDTTNVTMYHTYFNRRPSVIGYARIDSAANASDGNWTFFGCAGSPNNGINCSDNVIFYAPLELGPGNPNTVYFGTDRLYRSIDKGVNNNVVSQAPLSGTAKISAIGIASTNDNVRVVGMNDGSLWGTTTGSSSLTNLDLGNVVPNKYIGRVVIDPLNANTVYVTLNGYGLATNAHVWRGTNLSSGAPTWSAIGGSGANVIGDVPVNALAADGNDPSLPGVTVLYAGTDIGVYRSLDGGTNWMPFGTGLPRVAVFGMAIQPSYRALRIATHGRGMWEISLPGAPTVSMLSAFRLDLAEGAVRLHWQTGTELKISGFNLYRSQKRTGTYKKLNAELIVAKNAGKVQGASYMVRDRRVKMGKRYFYKIEIVVSDGPGVWSEIQTIRVQ